MATQNHVCGKSKKPGKIILFGEHFVVYQAPALSIPVHSLHLVCQANKTSVETSTSSTISTNVLDTLQTQALSLLGNDSHRFQLDILSTIPMGKGLGSSAALCVAVIEALAACHQIKLEKKQCVAFSNELEKFFHHFPSGLDVTTIIENLPLYFHSLHSYQALCKRPEIQFLIIDTGIKRNTKEAVLAVKKLKTTNPVLFQKCFDSYNEIAEAARLSFEKGNLSSIPDLMCENQRLLKTIGVSHPRIDDFIDLIESNGLHGAKISGAGLGGILILPIITPHHHLLQLLENINDLCSKKEFEGFQPLGIA